MATDTTPPTIAITSSWTVLKPGQATGITFTLSEPSEDFSQSDITVIGGTLGGFGRIRSDLYVAIFTLAMDRQKSGSISVGSAKFSDAAYNFNVDGSDANNTIIFKYPAVVISSNKQYLGFGESALVTFTLAEPTTKFSASSISVRDGVISEFTGSGAVYTAKVKPTGTSTAIVGIRDGVFSENNLSSVSIVPFDSSKANVEWTRLQGSLSAETSGGIAASTDGTLYTTGSTINQDSFITKYSADGVVVWTRSFGLSGSSSRDIATAPDGSVYVTGEYITLGARGAFITKYTTNGEKAWTRLLTSGAPEGGSGIVVASDGSVYVAGTTHGNLDGLTNSGGGGDAFIAKYSADGNKVWIRLLGTASFDAGLDISIGRDGSLYVLGATRGNLDGQVNNGDLDVFVTKYTPEGTRVWTKLLGTAAPDYAGSITTASDGSVYITGSTLGGLNGQTYTGSGMHTDIFICKLNPDGVTAWTRMTGTGFYSEEGYSIISDADGSVYIGGLTGGNLDGQLNHGNGDAFVSKYTADGSRVWTRIIGTSEADYGKHLAISTDGSLYFGGQTWGSLDGQQWNGSQDVFLTKLIISDKVPPTITVRASQQNIRIGDSATLNFTLSEPSDSFSLSDISVRGGTLGNFQGVGKEYSVQFTAGADALGGASVTVASGTFSDPYGNLNQDGADADNRVAFSITPPSYNLSSSANAVDEGSTGRFILATTNIAPGVALPYSISGVAGADLSGGKLSGMVTIDGSGTASITVPIAADKTTEGDETLVVTVQGQSASMTIKDTSVYTVPEVISFEPTDGAKAVAVGSNLQIGFNGPVLLGTGPITLKTPDGKVVESFTSANATVSGSTLTLNPTADLSIFTRYVVELGAGAVKDAAGNGNAADNRYDFQTATQDGLYHFFVVAFAAAPGATYMGQLAEAVNFGLPLDQIVEIFTTKKQFTDVYPTTMSNRELSYLLINNIVKMSASQAAAQSAADDIDAALSLAGWSRGKMLYTVFGNLASKPLSDATWGNTAKQFQNQLAVARYFTEELGVATENLATLRGVIGNVTPETDVSTIDKIVQIIGSIPPGG
jgi:hypothetical protein